MKRVHLLLLLFFTFPLGANEILTLDDCVKIATENNERIRAELARENVSEDSKSQTLSNMLPSASISWNYKIMAFDDEKRMDKNLSIPVMDHIDMSPNDRSNTLSAHISQPISGLYARYKNYRAASEEQKIGRLSKEATRLDVATLVKKHYISAIMYGRMLEFFESRLKVMGIYEMDYKNMLETGAGDRRSLLNIQVERHELQKEMLDIQLKRRVEMASLGRLIGKNIDSFKIVPPVNGMKISLSFNNLHNLLKRNNPAIKMIAKTNEAEKLRSEAAIDSMLPQLSLSGGYTKNFEGGSMFQPGITYSASLSLSFPIGSNLYGAHSAFKKQRHQALVKRLEGIDRENGIALELFKLFEKIQFLEKKIVLSEEQIKKAARSLDMERARLLESSTTERELLDSEIALRKAETAKINLESEYLLSLHIIADVTGTKIDEISIKKR